MGMLKVLMWRHLISRKRRWCYTLLDHLIPFFFSLLLYWLIDGIFGGYSRPEQKQPDISQRSNTRLSMKSFTTPTRILYSPKTRWIDELMLEVGTKLNLPPLKTLPEEGEEGICPFSEFEIIEDYANTLHDDDAIVIFQNANETLPNTLNYTIRMKKDFRPRLVRRSWLVQFDNAGYPNYPRSDNIYMYEPFLRLQWAIDTSYLHLLTGINITQSLTMQVLPYATNKEVEHNIVFGINNFFFMSSPLGMLLSFVFQFTRLMQEKNSGVQELMKMMGVPINMICLSHVLNMALVILLFTVTIAHCVTSTIAVEHTNFFFVYFAFLLHTMTIAAFAFPLAYILNTSENVGSIATAVYLLCWQLLPKACDYIRNETGVILFLGILLHEPMTWFRYDLSYFEIRRLGLNFNTISERPMDLVGSALQAYLFMVLQILLFATLTWYLSRVRPGKYGQALPYSFPFDQSYWKGSPKEEVVPPKSEVDEHVDRRFFEDPPKDAVVGIRILNVSKNFKTTSVLSDVTMDVLKGEITVLLGHNGAGKTTLINIITGLVSATSGKVLVNGLDTRTQAEAARPLIGICPQHNLFFPDLTVLEQVKFFALLKGKTFFEATETSILLLEKSKLENKIDTETGHLSGGMMRRLQLVCALSGGSSVLILDEPTSGLDVETRRELWDLLLSLRGEHTVLMTTHFMEEADALGDRIVALHSGILKCNATPMFVKKAIGSGFRLSLTTTGQPKEAAITEAIKKVIPEATVRDKSLNAISYTLPAKGSAQFPTLFTELEAKRIELEIRTIGVGKSTLDEVFMALCSDVTTSFADEQEQALRPEPTYKRLSGFGFYWSQYLLLLKRQYYYITSMIYGFLVFQVALKIILVFALTYGSRETKQTPTSQSTALNLGLYENVPQKRVLIDVGSNDSLPALRRQYATLDFEYSQYHAKKKKFKLRGRDEDYLMGVELNDTDAKIMYSTAAHQAAPVAVNLLSNVLARRLAGRRRAGGARAAATRPITTLNHPLDGAEIIEPKPVLILGMIFIIFYFIVAVDLASNIRLPYKERESSTRHIHIMCGCPVALHWAATLTTHLCIMVLIALLPFIIAQFILEKDHTSNQRCFSLVMIVGMAAANVQGYFFSILLQETALQVAAQVNIFCCGVILPLVLLAFSTGILQIFAFIGEFLVPVYGMCRAIVSACNAARENAMCSLNKDKCPYLSVPGFDGKRCCEDNPWSYYEFKKGGTGYYLIVLVCQFFLYSALVLLSEYKYFHKWHNRMVNYNLFNSPKRFNDPVVVAERALVEKAIQQPKDKIVEAILCHRIRKRYVKYGSKFYALKEISFSVKKGECFGLLGVNGAGKTTTFKILNGEVVLSSGNLFSNGYFIDERMQYIRTLSYCPQFFGLDDFLTGRQNLELVLTMRGLDSGDVKRETVSWIEEVGLTVYADRRVSTYSGGCMRRLAAVAALCQRADTALLDEPTAGVDTGARRRVHAAVLRAKRTHSIIVASHSLDEMEALCERLCIMAGGEIAALGSSGDLRAQHATGFAVVFKLFPEYGKYETKPEDKEKPKNLEHFGFKRTKKFDSDSEGTAERVTVSSEQATALKNKFKEEMQKKFNCQLKDEHQTTMHFQIIDNMPYSQLFTIIEELKKAYPQLIEDYSLTETTLEEVFLYIAAASGERQGIDV